VNVVFDSKCEAYFEYGTAPESLSWRTDTLVVDSNLPAERVLSGLLPNTRYYYRTCYRRQGVSAFSVSDLHTFVTRRPKGSDFVFTVEADPHPYDKKCYAPLWDIALRNQLNDGADFMLDLGDTFGDDHEAQGITSARVKELMLDERPHFGVACHSLPLFFCIGNHEGESGYYLLQTPPDNIAVYESLWRKEYYPNPYPDSFYSGNTDVEGYGIGMPENYYSWEWGDALFVVLDSWRYSTASVKPRGWEWTLGKKQYDWLKGVLENSTAKYRFVFCHHIMGECRGAVDVANSYEWGGMDNGRDRFAENRAGWDMPIHQLLLKNKVNILFQGHDHVYAYEKLDDLVYQTLPMPSDSSYTLGYIANAAAFRGTVLTGSGHLRVKVSADSVQVDFVHARLPKDEGTVKNGQVAFSYSVKAPQTERIEDVSSTVPSAWLQSTADGRLIVRTAYNVGRPCEIILNYMDGTVAAIYKFTTLDDGMTVMLPRTSAIARYPKLCIARLVVDKSVVARSKIIVKTI
jgi:hypothetical protein